MARIGWFCMFLLALAAPAHATGEALDGRAIRKMLPGRFEASALGFKFDFTLARNGAVLGRFGEWQDTGKWDVREDKLCIALSRWTSGSFRCAPILKTAQGGYRAGPFAFRKK